MLKSESRQFDDLVVTVQQLPAMRGVLLSRKLARIAAPAIGALKSVSLDADVSVLGDALVQVLEQLSEKDLEELIKTLLETATVEVDGKIAPLRPVFDMVFAGKVLTVFKVLAFAIEVNFLDFFGPLRAMSARKALEKSELKSKA